MSDIDRVIALLRAPSIEKQIAATVVLGELGVRSARCTDELTRLVGSDVPLMQRHALDALARLGAKKAVPKILPLLVSHDADVRRSAMAAITSVGDDVVPTIRARLPEASPEEKRALDAILAELGGKEAFATLIEGLAQKEGEAAQAAALAFRQRLKAADGRARRTYLAETERFLKKKFALSPNAVAAAIKILGFLEDEQAIPTLLSYAADKKALPAVRQEAIIALRFALGGGKAPAKVIDALLDAAEQSDHTLAQTALHTLGALPLPATAARRVEKLASHPDGGRAAFVLALLGRQGTPEATRALVAIALSPDRRKAEAAAKELEGKELSVVPIARALIETKDHDRAWLLRNVLRPMAKKVPPALQKELLAAAMSRLGDGERGWEPLLDIARDAAPDAVAGALRALAGKLRKTAPEKAATVLSVLCRSDRATEDDRYTVAALLLAQSPRDTRPTIRAGDEALQMLSALLSRGYDVASALKKDRSLEPDHLYYVGFHFAELGHPMGEELLQVVVDRGGRGKIARMAKNKLALVQR